MKEQNIFLTIITPTYNRAKLIPKCFQSLKRQTSKDFQWLVIDDGSIDDTREIILNMQKEADFQMDYVYKENGGKHTALNKAHPYIKGRFVTIVDSDDYLVEDAVQQIKEAWMKFEYNSEVGSVIFLKGFSETEPICTGTPDYEIVDTLSVSRKGKIGRDCFDIFRTELFVKYPFPEFLGEKFIGEGAAFFFIEQEKKGVYVNRVLYICDYMGDGLTKAGRKMRLQNPLGGRYNSQIYMSNRLPIKTRIKKGMLYTCYSLFANISFYKILKENPYKIMTLITFFPGVVLYFYWKKKYFS